MDLVVLLRKIGLKEEAERLSFRVEARNRFTHGMRDGFYGTDIPQ